MKKLALLLCASWSMLMACSKSDSTSTDPIVVTPPPVNPVDTTPITKYDITQLSGTTIFESTPTVTPMLRQDYNELSGVAASQTYAGILYMHNDAKSSPVIITNAKGEDLGRIILDNIQTQNPEDISVGPGPVAGKNYIYLADIGDNKAARASVVVYRFQEPVISNPSSQTEIHISVADIDKITVKYPGGAYNAETILVDPLTKDIAIASKETAKSMLYTAPYPQSTDTVILLRSVLKMPFDLLTSGDISPDGSEILLRNTGGTWYWKRQLGQSIAQALLGQPQKAPFTGTEHQGEGICFAADGSGYYTNTEIRDYPGAVSNISFYKRK